jgi:REP element-mobilizing transposase RayT
VTALKKFTSKQIGSNIWQRSYYDHIIRNEEDYIAHMQYIDENPKKWLMGKDEYYA